MPFQFLSSLLFPRLCLACTRFLRKEEVFLCTACKPELRFHETLFCGLCDRRLAENKKICHPQSFLLGAALYYESAAKNILHNYKFKKAKEATPFLAKLLHGYLESLTPQPLFMKTQKVALVPIPLGKKRLEERGFNQSLLLAEALSLHYLWPVEANLLKRKIETAPQSLLTSKEDRQKNVLNCFEVQPTLFSHETTYLLLDDISTTGATLKEAVRVLREAGAKKVCALTVAHSPT